ncbi:cation diffusion facilitator family transporter, partial [Sedimenticola sp.]|uniref:cation diffusion facilitator family transporter n=1 Tax=Sedimenticola sp. TaxID=1940285 RepID=UPI003D151DDC
MFHTHSSGGDSGSAAVYRTLITALLLTLAFSSIEAVAGWYAHSLALLSDAGHMLSDGLALGLAGLSAWLGQRAPSRRHSYGLGRSELLAALFNTLLMLGIVIAIVVSAVDRLQSGREVGGETVTVVALIGLLINGLVAWLLSRGERNLNLQAALLHVLGDL